MAKTFAQMEKVAKIKHYSDAASALILLAKMNSLVDFSPVLKHGSVAGNLAASAQYNVQIAKRLKSQNAVTTGTANSTARDLAVLDSFSTPDWESIEIGTGALRTIGVKYGLNEKYDADKNGSVYQDVITSSTGNVKITRKQSMLEMIFNNATIKAASKALPSTDLFTFFSDQADALMLKTNDFQYMTDKPIIFMHPTVVTKVDKEIGTVFNQETAIYNTGLKTPFNINGIPVIKLADLNVFEKTAATDRLGAIVMDAESIAFKADVVMEDIDTKLALTRFKGKAFYDIQHILFENQIQLVTFDASSIGTKSDGVND